MKCCMKDLRNEWCNNVQVSMQVKTMPKVANIYKVNFLIFLGVKQQNCFDVKVKNDQFFNDQKKER